MIAWLALALIVGDDLKGDPEAIVMLRESARACRTVAAYQDQGRFVIASHSAVGEQSTTWPLTIRKAGPNRLAIDAGDVKLFADGQTIMTLIGPTRKLMTGPCPESINLPQLTEGPLGAMLLGGPYRAVSRVLLALMFEDDAIARLAPEIREVQAGDDSRIDDRPCKTIRIRRQAGPDLILAIDAETRLPRAIDLEVDPAQFAAKLPGADASQQARIGWISGPISTEPPDPTSFRVDPPRGYTQVKAVQVPPEKPADP